MTNTKRSRGYAFEIFIVDVFSNYNWMAKRLGGTSKHLPDIIATNNKESEILFIECKATSSNFTYIPHDEIKRCNDMIPMFGIYRQKQIVVAFKFREIKKKRKLKYYMFQLSFEDIDNVKSVTCNYDGKLKLNYYQKTGKMGYIVDNYAPYIYRHQNYKVSKAEVNLV